MGGLPPEGGCHRGPGLQGKAPVLLVNPLGIRGGQLVKETSETMETMRPRRQKGKKSATPLRLSVDSSDFLGIDDRESLYR